MFERLREIYRESSVARWIREAYLPIFNSRLIFEKELVTLDATANFLEDLAKELEDPIGKDPKTMIRERWQGMQVRKTVEHYRVAVLKLHELLENMPHPPDKPRGYNIVIYDDQSSQ